MINSAIYKQDTGEILRFVGCQAMTLELQYQEGEEFYLNCPPDATHIINNEPVTIIPEPIPPTEAEIRQALVNTVQRHLDTAARSRNYDGILSLCSYATSTDPVFAAEAQAGVKCRDACWRHCYQVLADVQTGIRTIPTPDDLVVELPVIIWPTTP